MHIFASSILNWMSHTIICGRGRHPTAFQSPRSLVVTAFAGVCGVALPPLASHTKDKKTGRFVLISLALGTNELGIRCAGSESV